MRQSDLDEVRSLQLFSGMSEETFGDLMRGAYMQSFPPQLDLIKEGESADFLHVVVEGSVELYSTWEGRETTMANLRPISTFILAATITDRVNLMSARTMDKARIILIPSEDVRDVFEKDSEFAKSIVVELGYCYRNVIRGTKNLKLRSSAERLANYILGRLARQGGGETFELPYEKRRLASFLGMTPESLSRGFVALKKYGVYVDRNLIEIRDRAKLEAYAKPTPLIDGVVSPNRPREMGDDL